MMCLCEKGSGLCSVHSTSPYIIGWTSSESEVQKPSLSKSLSLKVDVLRQQCHKNKELCSQFQELDSSSIPSTVQSIGIQDFALAPPLLDHSQSLAHIAFHYADPCYTGLLTAAYGTGSKIHHAQLMGSAPVRIPLPLDLKEPIYVNSKQYRAILRRRQYRAKLEAHNKFIKDRKPYLHESRHVHAIKRARGVGGRFVNTKKLQESKLTSANHGLNVSTHTHLNLSGNMAEPKMYKVENYRDGASTTTFSDITCAYNRDDIFQQQESDFRLCPRWKGYAGLYS